MCPLPVVAIGGITINNASILIRHKVDAIAVINGLFGTQNMTDMTTNFTKLFV
jgi:thiamine-phosphate pyrophosphorylase